MRNFFRSRHFDEVLGLIGTYLVAIAAAVLMSAGDPVHAATAQPGARPTIVLVHGAFAESSSWDGVSSRLIQKGYRVVAVANPLRGVESDATYVRDVLKGIDGPVVLVGHSYGGSVISNASHGSTQLKALVYVSAFAPESGESAAALSSRFPGSTLGATLASPVVLTAGGRDLYIQQDKFPKQFAADVPQAKARLMAAAQRPITESALNEAAGAPGWKDIPVWSVFGSADKNIPPAALRFMAERAKSKKIVEVQGSSHVVMVSHPDAVAKLIEEAATVR